MVPIDSSVPLCKSVPIGVSTGIAYSPFEVNKTLGVSILGDFVLKCMHFSINNTILIFIK